VAANINYQYCEVDYEMTLYVDPDFPNQECTEDMDNYNGADACLAEDVDADGQAISCEIPIGSATCTEENLVYQCYVDENDQTVSCTSNSPT